MQFKVKLEIFNLIKELFDQLQGIKGKNEKALFFSLKETNIDNEIIKVLTYYYYDFKENYLHQYDVFTHQDIYFNHKYLTFNFKKKEVNKKLKNKVLDKLIKKVPTHILEKKEEKFKYNFNDFKYISFQKVKTVYKENLEKDYDNHLNEIIKQSIAFILSDYGFSYEFIIQEYQSFMKIKNENLEKLDTLDNQMIDEKLSFINDNIYNSEILKYPHILYTLNQKNTLNQIKNYIIKNKHLFNKK